MHILLHRFAYLPHDLASGSISGQFELEQEFHVGLSMKIWSTLKLTSNLQMLCITRKQWCLTKTAGRDRAEANCCE